MRQSELVVDLDRFDPRTVARHDPHIPFAYFKVGSKSRDDAIVSGAIDGPLLDEYRQQSVGAHLHQGALAAPWFHVNAITGHSETVASAAASPEERRFSARHGREKTRNAPAGRINAARLDSNPMVSIFPAPSVVTS